MILKTGQNQKVTLLWIWYIQSEKKKQEHVETKISDMNNWRTAKVEPQKTKETRGF